jgi:hypothetical protein
MLSEFVGRAQYEAMLIRLDKAWKLDTNLEPFAADDKLDSQDKNTWPAVVQVYHRNLQLPPRQN